MQARFYDDFSIVHSFNTYICVNYDEVIVTRIVKHNINSVTNSRLIEGSVMDFKILCNGYDRGEVY